MTNLFEYYSKFVPKTVLEKLFSSGKDDYGYNDLKTQVLALPNTDVIADIANFIFSSHSKYVLETLRAAVDFTLFVEYGEISFAPIQDKATSQKFGITIIHEWNMNANDNPNEVLIMDKCKTILEGILWKMYNDNRIQEGCAINLIDFPCQIIPVQSELLENHIGWTALFNNSNTSL